MWRRAARCSLEMVSEEEPFLLITDTNGRVQQTRNKTQKHMWLVVQPVWLSFPPTWTSSPKKKFHQKEKEELRKKEINSKRK